jgi:hypothetical protein
MLWSTRNGLFGSYVAKHLEVDALAHIHVSVRIMRRWSVASIDRGGCPRTPPHFSSL